MKVKPVCVLGSGSYLPGDPVPFDRIEEVLGTLDEAPPKIRKWIDRTGPVMAEILGIEYCHFAFDPVTGQFTDDNVTMAVKAARKALDAAGLAPSDIDFIAYGSAHMDQMPTASVRIQEALGIRNCAEMGIHANCTSAYKALMAAYDFLRIGRYRTALVLSSGISSSELRAGYYNQPLIEKEDVFLRWFLCDGAGALVLRSEDQSEVPSAKEPLAGTPEGVYLDAVYIESAGGTKESAMGNRRPAYWMNPLEEYRDARHHLRQMFRGQLRDEFREEGRTVFVRGLERMIQRHRIDLNGLRYFQVNMPAKHIVELVKDECEALGISRDTFYTKLDTMGYSGPPMAFICLDRILREEPLESGDLILSFVTEVSKYMQAGYTMRVR